MVAEPIHIPTNSVEGSLFSICSPEFVICRIFNDGYSDQCEVRYFVVSIVLICISQITSDVEHLF